MEAVVRHLLLSLALFLGWAFGAQAEEKKKDQSPFEKMVEYAGGSGAFQYFLYGFVDRVAARENWKEEGSEPLKGFSKELLRALERPGTKDHELGLWFVQVHAGCARTCAFDRR